MENKIEDIEVNGNEPTEPKENMEKPKKPRSQKQIESLKKAQETLRKKREDKAKLKEQEKGIIEPSVKMDTVKTKHNGMSSNIVYGKDDVSDDDVIEYVKPKKVRKKKKRIVVEHDSSTDSEEEIVISRRRRNKKKPVLDGHNGGTQPAKPIPIPTNPPVEDDEEIPVMEKERPVKNEPLPPQKKYTHQQLLRAYGL